MTPETNPSFLVICLFSLPNTAVALRFAGEMFHSPVVDKHLATSRETLLKLGFPRGHRSLNFCRNVSGRYDLCYCGRFSCNLSRDKFHEKVRNVNHIPVSSIQSKGLAKLGNIVAETLLRMQMFANLAARETYVAETNFAARKTKNVFAWSQKHFCFPDTNFASETYVSQFSHPGKHNKKHCFRNNVS